MIGDNMGLVVDVIGLLRCGIVSDLLFSLEMIGEAGAISDFGAGSRFAYSRIGGVLWVWW